MYTDKHYLVWNNNKISADIQDAWPHSYLFHRNALNKLTAEAWFPR
jgi:hypothetical protein